MSRNLWRAAVVGMTIALAACGGGESSPASDDSADATAAASAPSDTPSQLEEASTAAEENGPEQDESPELNAKSVADDLAEAQGEATVVEFTEDNDPNDLLGRPNGYVAAANVQWLEGFDDQLGVDRGATVEEWPDHEAALNRAKYIQAIGKESPALANEYGFVKDNILIRVSGEVKPSEVEALNVIGGEKVTAD